MADQKHFVLRLSRDESLMLATVLRGWLIGDPYEEITLDDEKDVETINHVYSKLSIFWFG